jgi:glycosyltransferase involved in cell wall biosynthesis
MADCMDERPLCSLVMPSYNVERYIADALDSALAQTYRPLEIVVIDDGSTDGTADVVAGYREHPEVVYVRQENRGLAGARNRGVAESHGKYVGLLDADDIWMPTKVEKCVALLEAQPDVGWVTTDCFLMQDEQKTQDHYYGTFEPKEFPTGAAQLPTLATRNFMSVACVIRRSLFDRFGTYDEGLRSSEDYDLWIRFMLGGTAVARIDEPLGWYRLRADSLSADPAPQWETHLTVLERHAHALWTRGARIPARECYDIARRAARRGDRVQALRFASMAARATDVDRTTRAKYALSALRDAVTPVRGARANGPATD